MKVKWRKSGKKSFERRILCPDNALGGGGGGVWEENVRTIAVRWFVSMAGGLNWLKVLPSSGCGENFRSIQELRMCLSAYCNKLLSVSQLLARCLSCVTKQRPYTARRAAGACVRACVCACVSKHVLNCFDDYEKSFRSHFSDGNCDAMHFTSVSPTHT